MKVDFYILETNSELKALHFACKLSEKAYLQNQNVYIHTQHREDAERMDALLWTYQEDTFIPHQVLQSGNEGSPILIGYAEVPINKKQILLNLTREIPSFISHFRHLIEIVFTEPTVQQLARERFKQYRERGFELNTYKIKD